MAKQFIILLSVISLIYGQQNHITQSNPCEEAVRDAKNDVEKWLWIEAGFRAFRISKKLSKKLMILVLNFVLLVGTHIQLWPYLGVRYIKKELKMA